MYEKNKIRVIIIVALVLEIIVVAGIVIYQEYFRIPRSIDVLTEERKVGKGRWLEDNEYYKSYDNAISTMQEVVYFNMIKKQENKKDEIVIKKTEKEITISFKGLANKLKEEEKSIYLIMYDEKNNFYKSEIIEKVQGGFKVDISEYIDSAELYFYIYSNIDEVKLHYFFKIVRK